MKAAKKVLVLDRKLLEERDYWIKHLSIEFEPSSLHLDYHRPSLYSGATDAVEVSVTGETYGKLMRLTGGGSFLLYTTLMAALKICLHKHTGNKSVIIGSPAIKEENNPVPQINALAIADEVDERLSFKAFLLNVRRTLLDAYAMQHYPFTHLIDDLGLEDADNKCPLFDVSLALEDIHEELAPAKNDIAITFSKQPDRLSGNIEYNTDLFKRESLERFAGRFTHILKEILKDVNASIWQLRLVTEEEEQQILKGWNATLADYPKDVCFHQLFEAIVKQRPDDTALLFGDREITYIELNRRSNQLAHYLRRLGVGPEVMVAVCVDRSPDIVISLLAIMKSGGVYLPLDPSYPKERLAFMLGDARARVLLTQAPLAHSLPEHDAETVHLDSDWGLIAQESDADPVNRSMPDNLAYVIYTSGSTGQPKGVQLPHRGLCNLSEAQIYAFDPRAYDRVLQFSSFTFDASVFEMAMSLRVGGAMCLASRDSLLPGPSLVRLLAEKAITNITIPPSVLAALPANELPALRVVIVAGEACPPSLVERWAKGRRFFNAYGLTETTVWATTAECSDPNRIPPIGHPITNTQVYLLDHNLQPMPVMVSGELHIGGVGLARGYLNRPDLTAERFIPDPFSEQPGARLYRTGDLGRYLDDGSIEYVGRIDHQVKINGYRIELGELEAALSKHPAIQDVAVIAHENGDANRRLVAYAVLRQGAALTIADVRSYLSTKLPEYMSASALVIMQALPLTPHGKVDRKALPEPDHARPELGEGFVAPRSPLEEVIAGMCASVLGLEQIGVNDSFFDLGGNSLLATQVISRMCDTLQVDVPLHALFENPTVGGLAASVEAAGRAGKSLKPPPILPVPRDGALPLSFAQQRLWFLDQLEPDNAFYNVATALRLRGKLDTSALEQSLNEIIRRHESLRTTYKTLENQAVQLIAPPRTLKIPEIDLRQHPAEDREAEARRMASEEGSRSFDLAEGPVLRVKLLRFDEEDHVALLNMHHIVCDGWSLGILINEVAALYECYSTNKPSPLPELPVQYADYAVWQRRWLQGEVLDEQLSYWRRQLEDAPPLLDLPTDRPRPQRQSFKGARLPVAVPEEVSDSLKALSQSETVTLFMTLLAAFQTLLMRYSGRQDIIVCTPIANRNRPEIERLIGYFANTLVLRTDLSGNPTFRELLSRVRDVTLNAYMHQDVPFERLVEELQPERSLSHHPIAQVVFVLQNAPMPQLQLTGLSLAPLEIENPTAKFDLTFNMWDTERGLLGSLEYNTDLFDAPTIARMLRHYENLLRSAASRPETRLDSLEFLSEEERTILEQPLSVEDFSGSFSF